MPVTRRGKTRLALIRAGQRLFAERPIDVVSIDDIVQAAKVGRGSFYNHFRDKEEFERDIIGEARKEMEAAISEAATGETDPALRSALGVCVAIRFAHEHPARARLVAREFIYGGYMDSRLNAGLLHDVSRGILEGRFAVPTAEIGVLTVLGLANAALIRSLEMPDRLTKIALAQQMTASMLRALGVAEPDAGALAAYAAETGIRARAGAPPQTVPLGVARSLSERNSA